jgi:hypothetical protein
MKSFRRRVLAAVLLVLAGCAGHRKEDQLDTAPMVPPAASAGARLDELLLFAGKLAESTPAQRLAECRQLRQRYRTDRSLDTRLHLLLAQSVAGACGELPDPSALIDDSLAEIGDERLKSFLIYHKAILARLDKEEYRRKSLEKRVSQNRSKVEKASRRLQSQEGELKELQKKLEALKAIEQSLDEPNDGHR